MSLTQYEHEIIYHVIICCDPGWHISHQKQYNISLSISGCVYQLVILLQSTRRWGKPHTMENHESSPKPYKCPTINKHSVISKAAVKGMLCQRYILQNSQPKIPHLKACTPSMLIREFPLPAGLLVCIYYVNARFSAKKISLGLCWLLLMVGWICTAGQTVLHKADSPDLQLLVSCHCSNSAVLPLMSCVIAPKTLGSFGNWSLDNLHAKVYTHTSIGDSVGRHLIKQKVWPQTGLLDRNTLTGEWRIINKNKGKKTKKQNSRLCNSVLRPVYVRYRVTV